MRIKHFSLNRKPYYWTKKFGKIKQLCGVCAVHEDWLWVRVFGPFIVTRHLTDKERLKYGS